MMARFYWVFDGFVEPEHCHHYFGPEHGLKPPPIREELRALLESTERQPKDERAKPAPNVHPPTSNFR